jgi:hypothetical protein
MRPTKKFHLLASVAQSQVFVKTTLCFLSVYNNP